MGWGWGVGLGGGGGGEIRLGLVQGLVEKSVSGHLTQLYSTYHPFSGRTPAMDTCHCAGSTGLTSVLRSVSVTSAVYF